MAKKKDDNLVALVAVGILVLLLFLIRKKPAAGAITETISYDPAYSPRPPIVLFPGTIFEVTIPGWPEKVPANVNL